MAAWRLLPLAALLALAAPASGAMLRDEATGLALNPPPPYEASRLAPAGAQAVRFALRRPEEQETGCQVAFAPAPPKDQPTQDRLNALTRSSAWQALERARLATAYDVLEEAPFEQAGITGLRLVGDVRPRTGLPARALGLRSLFAILETPRGRTTTVCVAEKPAFEARRVEFMAVIEGVLPPR